MTTKKVKPHGNTGKRNAAKDNPKSDRIVVRVTPNQKAIYNKRAKKAGLTLSAWIEKTLDTVTH